jgi:hypothetical protein
MNRRTVLATAAAVCAAGSGGCVAGGRVVHDIQEEVAVGPGRAKVYEITDVDGSGAVSYTVRADQRFDVYYFPGESAFTHYEQYLAGETPSEMPSGHGTLSTRAVPTADGGYEAAVPDGGGREPVSVESTHYFVVDHTNYGDGVRVEETDERLSAFVNLTAYNKMLPI